ncbi:vacuolar protein sorting-associated protein 18 homolog [Varroa jacobsoni]|uniref:vacuolar protein sorting-associated protein 18 homolog n=1 Tax=Varroa jacobsoni TaxID=62625 RepID=UPI000BF38614|nr:vacuolar protein sorting-associated protein 18 homolog [Varroa jacobsoni]XP_022705298.1 vacuolar protein sorting-associated protein 18 homolog [Varroa jacobsoni]
MMSLDQYEQQTSEPMPRALSYASFNPAVPQNPISQLTKTEQETPMFKKLKIEFNPRESLTHLVACNETIVMGMIDKSLLRVCLKNPKEPEELSLSSQLPGSFTSYRMHHVFLDPFGNHLLVSVVLENNTDQGENFYIYLGGPNGSKRIIHKILRNHVLTAVAFNPDNRQSISTGPILLATSKGLIFEAEFGASTDGDWKFTSKSNSSEKYCKEIYRLKDEASVSGLHLELVSNPAESQPQAVVYVSTMRCLYTFFGPTVTTVEPQPVFGTIFTSSQSWAYNNSRELPNQSKKQSILHVLKPKGMEHPTHVACLFGSVGVYHGDLGVSTESLGAIDNNPWLRFCEEPRILGFDPPPQSEITERGQPVSMALSKYHILILFGDKLKVFSQLDHSLVMEDPFPQGGMLGLARDPISGSTWAFSNTVVFKYKVYEEDRYMWRVLLAKKKYEEAMLFCKNDPIKLNKVRLRQAQDLFRQGQFDESALKFSDTFASFEEVSLRFLEVDQDSALRILLKQKLNSLTNLIKTDLSKKTQLTMVATWLIQLYLNRLGHLKHQALKKDAECPPSVKAELATLDEELRNMLSTGSVCEVIKHNQQAFYKLIANHGDEELLLEFSEMMKDYVRVIQQHIQNKRYEKALMVLRNQRSAELYYRFSPELMSRLPEQLVNCWIAESDNLDPVKLIPALVQLTSVKPSNDIANEEVGPYGDSSDSPSDTFQLRAPHILQSIRYLEHCVDKGYEEDEAIHNYLIALYARLGDKEKLQHYLTSQGDKLSDVRYDAKFALRMFSELKLHKASLHVYEVMGLYSEALDLALQELQDVSLAQSIANKPVDDEERKKLWLVIAAHVIRKGEDVGKAMELLASCELLRIEDVLPFFPEFVCIDHFKEAICNSLQSYKGQISTLRDSMTDSTNATDQIRTEIVEVRNRCYVVDCGHQCDACGFALLSQAFFVFPCLHRFHAQCLEEAIKEMPLPPNFQSQNSNALESYRDTAPGGSQRGKTTDTASRGSSQGPPVGATATKTSIEDLCAQECLYCGELIAESTSVPFFSPEEYEQLHKQWL